MTKERKFKVGDTVKLLRHRNYFGSDLVPAEKLSNIVTTLTGVNDSLSTDEFTMFITGKINEFKWMVRSDDIELVSPSGPIQPETRRVLKPGVYGIVSVKEVYPFHDGKFSLAIQPCAPNADELESAAMVLSQLAEFLREKDA